VDDEAAALERTRPNQRGEGRMPLRQVRIPDDLWLGATAKAKDKGVTIAEVIRMSLREHLRNEN